jgi:hypothetical protein
MPFEERIIKIAVVSAITLVFSLIGWGCAHIFGMIWSAWFIVIIFLFTYKLFGKVNE